MRLGKVVRVPMGLQEITFGITQCGNFVGTVLRVYLANRDVLIAQYPQKAGVETFTYLLDEDVNMTAGVYKCRVFFNDVLMHEALIEIVCSRPDTTVSITYTEGGCGCEPEGLCDTAIANSASDASDVFSTSGCGC